MNYEFPSRRSIGDAFPLVSDICGVRRLRRGFHYSLHGTSRRERPNKGHLHAAKKMCPLSESTANRRWDYFSKTPLKCYAEIRVNVRCAALTRQTPHLDSRCARSLPSLSPQPGVHPRPPSPTAENVLSSLPPVGCRSIQQTT